MCYYLAIARCHALSSLEHPSSLTRDAAAHLTALTLRRAHRRRPKLLRPSPLKLSTTTRISTHLPSQVHWTAIQRLRRKETRPGYAILPYARRHRRRQSPVQFMFEGVMRVDATITTCCQIPLRRSPYQLPLSPSLMGLLRSTTERSARIFPILAQSELVRSTERTWQGPSLRAGARCR